MNVVNQGGKREWGATLNQRGSRSFPDTCHVGLESSTVGEQVQTNMVGFVGFCIVHH